MCKAALLIHSIAQMQLFLDIQYIHKYLEILVNYQIQFTAAYIVYVSYFDHYVRVFCDVNVQLEHVRYVHVYSYG